MINVWHFHGEDDWTTQVIDLQPDVTFQEILKSLDISDEPDMVIGDSDNYLAIFKGKEDKYAASVIMQDIEQMVIIHNFPNLLKFINLMNSTFLMLGDMQDAFGGQA